MHRPKRVVQPKAPPKAPAPKPPKANGVKRKRGRPSKGGPLREKPVPDPHSLPEPAAEAAAPLWLPQFELKLSAEDEASARAAAAMPLAWRAARAEHLRLEMEKRGQQLLEDK